MAVALLAIALLNTQILVFSALSNVPACQRPVPVISCGPLTAGRRFARPGYPAHAPSRRCPQRHGGLTGKAHCNNFQ
jgi:hypothetical protein